MSDTPLGAPKPDIAAVEVAGKIKDSTIREAFLMNLRRLSRLRSAVACMLVGTFCLVNIGGAFGYTTSDSLVSQANTAVGVLVGVIVSGLFKQTESDEEKQEAEKGE